MQQWLGNRLNPLDYGWEKRYSNFCPNIGYTEICPPSIYRVLACNCKLECNTGACGCKKLGLSCTEACKCSEDKCKNRLEVSNDDEEDEDDVDVGSVDWEDVYDVMDDISE